MCKQSIYSVDKMCSFLRSFLIAITLLFSAISSLQAQTIEGKEFWVTFGPIGNLPPEFPALVIQIRIVSGNTATTGTIHFTHLGTGADVPFSLAAHETYTYSLDALQREAVYNMTTGITDYSMRITSVEPIAVYTMNMIHYGLGDATNILPATVLEKEYYQISYPLANEFVSQSYAVLATQNATHLFYNGGDEVILNKGQVYFKTNINDMTGAHITANYPVAFFSSHNAAGIPIIFAQAAGYLQQQLAPVNHWGKHFFVPSSPNTRDIIRIVVSQNNTDISQTGGTIRTDDPEAQTSLNGLNAGQFVDLEVSNNGCHINATKPIGICTFLSSLAIALTSPSQCWVPSLEQTIPNAIIAPFIPTYGTQLNQHYALVITPTITKTNTTVSVGGAPTIPLFGGSGWIDNAESGMSVYTMPLTRDTVSYNFTNSAGLIILCYGSGIAVSYYYPAGFATRNLSAAFTANNIPYTELHNNPFCEHNITFVANIEGIHPNPGSLKWNINNVEEVNKRDSLEWSKTFATGNHIIKMSVLFEDNSTETYQDTLKIKTCEAVFYANGVLCDTLYKITFCDKVVYFQADVESPESIIWYINDPVHLSPLHVGETSWSKTYDAGEHHDFVEMVVVFENGETKTISGTVNVKVFWTSIKNIRH